MDRDYQSVSILLLGFGEVTNDVGKSMNTLPKVECAPTA
jgi:hypothetical protein